MTVTRTLRVTTPVVRAVATKILMVTSAKTKSSRR